MPIDARQMDRSVFLKERGDIIVERGGIMTDHYGSCTLDVAAILNQQLHNLQMTSDAGQMDRSVFLNEQFIIHPGPRESMDAIR